MPRPISYAVFCLKKKKVVGLHFSEYEIDEKPIPNTAVLVSCSLDTIYIVSLFSNTPANTEIYTLSLHDALPIWRNIRRRITIPLTLSNLKLLRRITRTENILHRNFTRRQVCFSRSEERFSRNAETDLVCRLLLEKKKSSRFTLQRV